jgi:carbon monoxide dehydrogenase subunit G
VELTNEFRVRVPVERAWQVLTDVPLIAPCLPGAELTSVEGDEYRGLVKVKVGPITAEYRGAARFLEKDESARRAVLRAEGRETRGQGNAHATVRAQLSPDGDSTRVQVATDLAVTGKVAQFGRGVLADVSAKLLQQFADCLEATVLAEGAAAPSGQDGSAAPQPEPASQPLDLVQVAGASVAKRAAPLAGLATALAIVWWLVRHPRRRR